MDGKQLFSEDTKFILSKKSPNFDR